MEKEIEELKKQLEETNLTKHSSEYLALIDKLRAIEGKRNFLAHNQTKRSNFFYSYTLKFEDTNLYRLLTTFLEDVKAQHDVDFKKAQEGHTHIVTITHSVSLSGPSVQKGFC